MKRRLELLAFLSIFAFRCIAATIHVPENQPTIQAGLDAAEAGDTVLVACGSYYEHDIAMNSGVQLRSVSGDPNCVVVDALRMGRVFECNLPVNATSLIEGLTITNGLSPNYGGGIRIFGGAMSLINVVISDNQAMGSSGGISSQCALTLRHVIVRNNKAGSDGGGVNQGGIAFFEDIQVLDNGCDSGGGGGINLTADDGSYIINATISRNHAGGSGGGLMCIGGFYGEQARMEFVTLESNSAMGFGGGVFMSHRVVASNLLIAENSAQSGGGWYSACSPDHPVVARLTQSIVVKNVGGGIDAYWLYPIVDCCDLYGNAPFDVPAHDQLMDGNGNFSADPQFCGIHGSGNYYLQSDSPCAPGNHPDGYACGLIGALPVDCGPVAMQEAKWSSIKSLY